MLDAVVMLSNEKIKLDYLVPVDYVRYSRFMFYSMQLQHSLKSNIPTVVSQLNI